MPAKAVLPKNFMRRGAKYILRKTGVLPTPAPKPKPKPAAKKPAAAKPVAKGKANVKPVAKKPAAKKPAVVKPSVPTDLTVKEVLGYMKGMIARNPGTISPVIVYFDGRMGNWYQLEMWLGVLEAVNRVVSVSLVVRNQAVFRRIIQTTDFPVFLCITIDDVMQMYDHSDIKCILYVNNAAKNFQSLIHKSALHIHINHGESDKLSTITNQATAYDYVFVVGEAAYHRYKINLLRRDMSRFVMIGRPQLEHIIPIDPKQLEFATTPPKPLDVTVQGPPTEETIPQGLVIDAEIPAEIPKTTVLYAPTWEGTHQTMNYSSIPVLGVELVKTLLDAPQYQVIYKPHPNTGSRDPATKESNQKIIDMVTKADNGIYVADADINSIYPSVTLPIFDNSSVTIDYLAHDRPMLLTDMFHRSSVRADAPPIVSAARLINRQDVDTITDIIYHELTSDPFAKERRKIKTHYLGDFDYGQGASTQAFIDKLMDAIAERDALVEERRKLVEQHSS